MEEWCLAPCAHCARSDPIPPEIRPALAHLPSSPIVDVVRMRQDRSSCVLERLHHVRFSTVNEAN